MVFVYSAVALAQISLRRRREREGAPQPPVKMWLFPYLSFAVLAGMAAVLLAMAFTPGLSRDLKCTCIALVATVFVYWVVRKLKQPRAAPSPAT
jgi:AAT family amino acid transporter/GABA permease